MSDFDEFSPNSSRGISRAESPREGSSWSLIIVTMFFLAYGIWSGYQIHDLRQLRAEVRDLKSRVDNHQVELSKLQVHINDEAE